MARSRRVLRGERFLDAAREFFPPGGSVDGRPSFELFEERVLLIAERRMSETFEDLPEAVEGTGIRFVMTHAVPYFPALVIDEDYFDIIENDPDS